MNDFGKRVLVADDDPVSRLYLTGLLGKWAYHVMAAEDGTRAFELLGSDDGPPLALLDWEMPGMDGVEVCRRLRNRIRGRPLYLVLLTGRSSPQDVVLGLEAGADDFLTKPFDSAELRSRLRVGERVLEVTSQLELRVSELVQALARVKQLEAQAAVAARV
jgi:phosphoserine phosphatase RsbU/P